MNRIANSAGFQLGDSVLTDLHYADDVALLVDDADKLHDVLLTTENEAASDTQLSFSQALIYAQDRPISRASATSAEALRC